MVTKNEQRTKNNPHVKKIFWGGGQIIVRCQPRFDPGTYIVYTLYPQSNELTRGTTKLVQHFRLKGEFTLA